MSTLSWIRPSHIIVCLYDHFTLHGAVYFTGRGCRYKCSSVRLQVESKWAPTALKCAFGCAALSAVLNGNRDNHYKFLIRAWWQLCNSENYNELSLLLRKKCFTHSVPSTHCKLPKQQCDNRVILIASAFSQWSLVSRLFVTFCLHIQTINKMRPWHISWMAE